MTTSLKDLTIAVVGATGAVGADFFRIAEERYSQTPVLRFSQQDKAGRSVFMR